MTYVAHVCDICQNIHAVSILQNVMSIFALLKLTSYMLNSY